MTGAGLAQTRQDNARLVPIELSGSLQNPVFSPDGQWLLFTRFRAGYNRGASDLYLYELSGGTLRALVTDGSSNVNLPGSSWNGARGLIAFSSTRGDHDEIFVIPADGASGQERQVTARDDLQAFEPSFSPDARWVVFESHKIDDARGAITKYRLDRGEYVALTDAAHVLKQPNWSSDGKSILYQAERDGEWAIFLLPASGGAAQRLTGPGISATDAVFSPDARWVYFSGETEAINLANIFRIRRAGGAVEQVSFSTGYDGAVSVSPDGRRIVFEASGRDPEHSRGTRLWILDL